MGEARRKLVARKALEVACPLCDQPPGKYCRKIRWESALPHAAYKMVVLDEETTVCGARVLAYEDLHGKIKPFKRDTVYRLDGPKPPPAPLRKPAFDALAMAAAIAAPFKK